MYEKPVEEIPWEIATPPLELIEVIKSGVITPCNALDIACGTGNYSIYLAENGFKVTGIDLSEKALEIAREKSASKKLEIRFLKANVLKLDEVLREEFSFILDYSLFHHVPFEESDAYAEQLYKRLERNGKLLLVCYSEKDSPAKITIGKYDNQMHYRSAGEIRESFKQFFELSYTESRLGKKLQHYAHCFLFEKR